ncbi:hypothetical protein BKA70DRAFT_1224669 [Coprinopsis sp. MPI-PUGE-AT-0042]|nr:hypothetical protein BKA70DRAFT_1224669 [Coprinopsis sp. MPI-PUGE-AT-0042]
MSRVISPNRVSIPAPAIVIEYELRSTTSLLQAFASDGQHKRADPMNTTPSLPAPLVWWRESKILCVVEKYTVGCQACYASLDRCSILDDHCIQTLVSRFGNTVQQAKEHLHLLSEVQSYFKGLNADRKVSSWDEINNIERRACAGGDELSRAMTDLRVLHLKLELDLLDQRLTAKSWGDTLMEISNRAMEAIDEVKEDGSDDFEKAVKDVARMASNALDAESSVPGLDD